jgi:hypothetical protein
MPSTRMAKVTLLAAIVVVGLAACGGTSGQSSPSGTSSTTVPVAQTGGATSFTSTMFVNAVGLTHQAGAATRPVIGPDDMAYLGGHIFVGFQNGVGSMGEASPLGKDSTIVEFDLQGHKVAQWDVVGKNDGLGADPATNRLIATVNEDGNSSVYLIDPTPGSAPVHYQYSGKPPHGGGTDAISVHNGTVLITASAPDSKVKSAPAVYRVSFDSSTHVATFHEVFTDVAKASVANTNHSTSGKARRLALSDPDSSAVVPAFATRFAGDYVLDSQGDNEQIFARNLGASNQSLSVLKLSASVDDAAWVADPSGAIYTTDNVGDAIHKITGPFVKGSEIVAVTPCNDNNAPSTCPGPGYPQNYLGQLNTQTGAITPIAVHGAATAPKGMLFIP